MVLFFYFQLPICHVCQVMVEGSIGTSTESFTQISNDNLRFCLKYIWLCTM